MLRTLWPYARSSCSQTGQAGTTTYPPSCPSPWYDPHYALTILGIVLGSVLNSVSLGLDTFFGSVVQERAEIEAQRALGASRREALARPTRNEVRRGMIPITNQMAAAGIITLPSTMTGQILAGIAALDAAQYQILLLFLLASPRRACCRRHCLSCFLSRWPAVPTDLG